MLAPAVSPAAELPADGRISLPQALEYARDNAPDMLVAHGGLAIGEAEVRAARQAQPFNPTVSLSLGQRRQAGGTGLDAEVEVEQQLQIGGQRAKQKAVAARFRELTRLGLDAAGWEVHADVHRSFEQALVADDRLALAHRLVSFDEELLEMARRRVEVGDESPVVLEVARAQLAVSRSSSVAAATAVETSRLALARSIGWAGPSVLQPSGELDAVHGTGPRVELVAHAVDASPTLRQADARTAWARAEVEAARRAAWPSPTVGISYAREGSTSTPGNFSPASDVWMGTIRVPLPTFARNQGPVARRHAELEMAEARGRATSVQFEAMVSAAAAQVDSTARQVEVLENEVVPAFERTVVALRRAYEVGELDFLGVAQSREQLWLARGRVLDARAAYYDAFAELERLVGPLPTDGDLGLSVETSDEGKQTR